MRVLVRVIPTLASLVVASASFALSFVALADMAARLQAVPADMAWLVPLCVDGAVLAASANLWASSLRGQRKDPIAFGVAAVLLVVSVVVNINHAGPAPLAKVIAALPPLTLLACLELVASAYRRDTLAREQAAVEERKTAEAAGPAAVGRQNRTENGTVLPSVERATAPVAVPVEPVGPVPPFDIPSAGGAIPATSAPAVEAAEPVVAVVPEPSPSAPAGLRGVAAFGEDAVLLSLTEVPLAELEVESEAGESEAGGLSGAERVRRAFTARVAAGTDPLDQSLVAAIAAELDMTKPYVRKVIAPLRRTDPAT